MKTLQDKINDITKEHNFEIFAEKISNGIKHQAILSIYGDFISFDCKTLEEAKYLLETLKPINKNTIIGTANDSFYKVINTPYRIDIKNPPVINSYSYFTLKIQYIIDQIDPKKVVRPPAEVHIEGGDVMLWNNYVFIGTYKGSDYKDYITARTNMQGVQYIKDLFPNKMIKEFDLVKSKIEARDNALHLDCCFQPVGTDKGIIYKRGFREEADYLFLVRLFGKENLFHITREEMYNMNSNVFSIDTNVVVSERNFTRLNNWLRANGFVVEEIPYAEIAKQEGLLRCSTLPLIRD